MVDGAQFPMPAWWQWFINIYQRTGGATGSLSIQIDSISDVKGSILYRGPAQWLGLNPGARYKVLRMGVDFPQWDFMDGLSFGQVQKNAFLVGPPAGPNDYPSIRQIVTGDLSPVAGQFPGTQTNDNASVGNIGQYVFSELDSGSAIALSSGSITDILSIDLSPGDWDVWANVATAPDVTTTTTAIRAWTSSVSATDPNPPNEGGYLFLQAALGTGAQQVVPVATRRFSVNAATRVYLTAAVSFGVSTLSAYGFIGARRAR